MKQYRRPITVAVVGMLALGLGACSSGSSTGTQRAGTHSSTGTQSTGSGGSSAPGAAGSDVAALVQKLESRPTEVPALGQKINKPIPSGKMIYTIDCGLPACVTVGTLVAEAASKLGWTTKDIKTDGSPQQISAAWQQVITDKPDFVLDEGAPVAQIKTFMTRPRPTAR